MTFDYNCSGNESETIACTLNDFGGGTGEFFNELSLPLGKFLMIIIFVMAIGAILASVVYVIKGMVTKG